MVGEVESLNVMKHVYSSESSQCVALRSQEWEKRAFYHKKGTILVKGKTI